MLSSPNLASSTLPFPLMPRVFLSEAVFRVRWAEYRLKPSFEPESNELRSRWEARRAKTAERAEEQVSSSAVERDKRDAIRTIWRGGRHPERV